MTWLVDGMLVALLIPIAVACRTRELWHRLAALASLSTKVALVMLVVSVVRNDPMPGLVGVLVLSIGNAGILLIANLLREREQPGP
jgi:multicomponent Na+:H+ antiporter subunit F